MTATVSLEQATTIQRHAASFEEGTARPLKAFQKMLGLMAAASPVLQLGLLHIRPSQFWLKQRVPSTAWCHGRHRVTVTRALFYKEHGCPGPRLAQPSALCFPSSGSATAGTQTSQGTTAQAYSNIPPLEKPTVGVRVIPAAESSPVPNPLETGPPLSSERHDMASMARVMGPACVAARREPFRTPGACPKHYGRS